MTINFKLVPEVGIGYYIARWFSISLRSTAKILSIPTRKQINLLALVRCPRWASNPHSLRNTILSRARIPIPPLGHLKNILHIFILQSKTNARMLAPSLCLDKNQRFWFLSTRAFSIFTPFSLTEKNLFFNLKFLRIMIILKGRSVFINNLQTNNKW